tara:strand:+ start:146 stop:343 length:198 start_codon:yes stop_codon:yes gene_type:complete
MTYKERITATFNQALAKKLRRESKQVSKAQMEVQASNASHVKKRRHAEDMVLARELGVNIQEIVQ